MADIQEIMNKMEALNKELSDIINETKEEGSEPEEQLELQTLGGGSGYGGNYDNCPDFTRKVDLCCTAVVKHFDVITDEYGKLLGPVKLIYDPSCLHAFVEKRDVRACKGKCDLPAYIVRVVGCLPFAFSAPDALGIAPPEDGEEPRRGGSPSPSPTTCPNPGTVDLCCQGCVCVDNSICCFPFTDDGKADAKDLAKNINDALESDPCSIINYVPGHEPKAKILKCGRSWLCSRFCDPDGCKDETYVKFTATLKIPDEDVPCTTPADDVAAPVIL